MLKFIFGQLAFFFPVKCIKFLHVQADVFVQTSDAIIRFVKRKIVVLDIDSLELAAIDGDKGCGEQLEFIAVSVELPKCFADGFLVVLTKIGDCPEVRCQTVDKLHHFDVASTFTFEPSERTDCIEIAINIYPQQVTRIITGAPFEIWLTPAKAKGIHIQTIHKSIEQTNRDIGYNILLDAVGKHRVLVSVFTFYIVHDYLIFLTKDTNNMGHRLIIHTSLRGFRTASPNNYYHSSSLTMI